MTGRRRWEGRTGPAGRISWPLKGFIRWLNANGHLVTDPGSRFRTPRLRHAYGKHCVDRGVDIGIIAEALGHESLESTKIYAQVSFKRTRRIAELFALPGG
jgi:site-specific recombinase XerD